MADDPALRMKLLHALYVNTNYQEAVNLGASLEKESTFKKSPTRIAYAWSLHRSGRTDSAEQVFRDMDKTNTNYEHRLQYCKFLKDVGRTDDLSAKTGELLAEFEFMRGPERKLHTDTLDEIRELRRAVPSQQS